MQLQPQEQVQDGSMVDSLKKKKPKKKLATPGFMQHLKPTAPTGKGLGKPKIKVK